MKLYPKDSKGMFQPPEPESTFDVEEQLEKVQLILQREVRNLLTASASGKLLPAHSRDLCAYIKLLSELKAAQESDLSKKTDEELAKLKESE